MAKSSMQYICQSCGMVHSKWVGQCEGCGAWNTLAEERLEQAPKSMRSDKKAGALQFHGLEEATAPFPRLRCGIGELDRVLGGGLVAGSAILIGGDPGIGKSTLLLQLVAAMDAQGVAAAYISGEESVAQLQMRAQRLGISGKHLKIAAANAVRDILASLSGMDAPKLVIIDSIQTMFVDNIDAAAGTVSQVRACSNELIKFAKKRDIALLLVGHVTKDGQIAGPRVMEHMVDTVLYFEGDRGHPYRILRSVKNRFGATDEIGVFHMQEQGLLPVDNPSALFLNQREQPVSGSAVFAGIEGSRPLLVEIQALVAPSTLATPRRAVVGWDSNRLAMVLAVLEARAGVRLSDREVYLNVAGGLRISEPAADLAVAAALLSALFDVPLDAKRVVLGELGLSGEVRLAARTDLRLKESAKLGFTSATLPQAKQEGVSNHAMQLHPISHIRELAEMFINARQF
jgi:DNA repair protein RadA/Sms